MGIVDLQKGLELPNGDRVHVISSSKRFRSVYTFYNSDGEVTLQLEGNSPHMLTRQSKIGKLLWDSCENPKTGEFGELCVALAEFQDYYETQQEEVESARQEEEEREYQEKIKDVMDVYKRLDNPILYLGSCIDWITAGERGNILISFFTLCSQVILQHPISLIGVGEGSSGKNHVCESALMMIPTKYVVMEKKPTLASMFRRAEEDTHYYDGKIVVYGDLGGDSDQEDVEETKNILKELQTDGKVNRPVTVKTTDGFEVVDLCLLGHPCLVYQTVPNYNFDDQELSRSMIITPRTDNRAMYNTMMQVLELVAGNTAKTHKEFVAKLSNQIPFIVEGLRQRYERITIVNPYMEVVEEFIGYNPHYKRDLPKLNSILKVITAFNGVNRETYKINGVEIMFTTKEDVGLFLSLFESYHGAIANSVTPRAMDILNDLKENLDDWVYVDKDEVAVFEAGITVNKYMEKGNVKLAHRSISRYFTELREAGYLTVTGKDGNASLYSLAKENKSKKIVFKGLSESSKKIIVAEYSQEVLDIVLNDMSDDKVNIFEQHSSIDVPPWMVIE